MRSKRDASLSFGHLLAAPLAPRTIAAEALRGAAAAPLPLVAPVARWGLGVSEVSRVALCVRRKSSDLRSTSPCFGSNARMLCCGASFRGTMQPAARSRRTVSASPTRRPPLKHVLGHFAVDARLFQGIGHRAARAPGPHFAVLLDLLNGGSFPRRSVTSSSFVVFEWSTSSSSSAVKRGSGMGSVVVGGALARAVPVPTAICKFCIAESEPSCQRRCGRVAAKLAKVRRSRGSAEKNACAGLADGLFNRTAPQLTGLPARRWG